MLSAGGVKPNIRRRCELFDLTVNLLEGVLNAGMGSTILGSL